jgi:hypothetical protein
MSMSGFGADAEDVAFFHAPNPQTGARHAILQRLAELIHRQAARLPAGTLQGLMKPERCGSYDASFGLWVGPEISVQDDDVLKQRCEVFAH